MALRREGRAPHLTRPTGLAGEVGLLRQEAADEFAALSERLWPTPVLNIYVSGVNGSDSNDGLTPTTALATLVAAEAMLPDTITANTIIHVGRAGLASETYAFASFRPRHLRGNLIVVGDGAGQSGAAGVSVVELLPSTAALAPDSGQGLYQVAGSWVAGAYNHKTIEILTGPNAGYKRMVAYNTSTRLIPVHPFEFAVGTGDTYRITGPTAVVGVPDQLATGEVVLVEGCGTIDQVPTVERLNSSFVVSNLGFLPTGVSGAVGMSVKDSSVVFFGVEIGGTTTLQLRVDNSSLSLGMNAVDNAHVLGVYGLSAIGCTTSLMWLGWGLGSPGANSGSSAHSFSGGVIDGFISTSRGCTVRDGAIFTMRGGYFYSFSATNPPLLATNNALVYILAASTLPMVFEAPALAQGGVIWVINSSTLVLGAARLAGSVAGISGLTCQYSSIAEVSGPLTGAVGGYGMLAMYGGVIKHFGALGGVTGTLGYISIDNHVSSDITGMVSSGKMAMGHGQIVRA